MFFSIFKNFKTELFCTNLYNCRDEKDILAVIQNEKNYKINAPSIDNLIKNGSLNKTRTILFRILLASKIMTQKLDSLDNGGSKNEQIISFNKDLQELAAEIRTQFFKNADVIKHLTRNEANPDTNEQNPAEKLEKDLNNYVEKIYKGGRCGEPFATIKRRNNLEIQIKDIHTKALKFKKYAQKYESRSEPPANNPVEVEKYKKLMERYTNAEKAATSLHKALNELYTACKHKKISNAEFVYRSRVALGDDQKCETKIELNQELKEQLDVLMNEAKDGIPELKKHREVVKLRYRILANIVLAFPLLVLSLYDRRSLFFNSKTSSDNIIGDVKNIVNRMDESVALKK